MVANYLQKDIKTATTKLIKLIQKRIDHLNKMLKELN